MGKACRSQGSPDFWKPPGGIPAEPPLALSFLYAVPRGTGCLCCPFLVLGNFYGGEKDICATLSFWVNHPNSPLIQNPSIFQGNKLNACSVVAGIASAHYGLNWLEGKCEIINYHEPLSRCYASFSGHLRRQTLLSPSFYR